MLRGVEIIYCEVKEEKGVMVCFLHRKLSDPPIGELEVPQHLDGLNEVKEFVEQMASDAGLVIEEDPYHEGVFHLFYS